MLNAAGLGTVLQEKPPVVLEAKICGGFIQQVLHLVARRRLCLHQPHFNVVLLCGPLELRHDPVAEDRWRSGHCLKAVEGLQEGGTAERSPKI